MVVESSVWIGAVSTESSVAVACTVEESWVVESSGRVVVSSEVLSVVVTD